MCTVNHKLVITGQDKTPVEINARGVIIIHWNDIATTPEEADIVIVQQAIWVVVKEPRSVTVSVLVDYTGVYLEQGLETPILMEYPIKEKTVTDITATIKQHQDIIPVILATHSLTGCDTVCTFFGIGKWPILKVLRDGSALGAVNAVRWTRKKIYIFVFVYWTLQK